MNVDGKLIDRELVGKEENRVKIYSVLKYKRIRKI